MTGQDARLNITSREITIFFSDIASFTTICESLRSKELYLLLSSYFEEMSKIIVDRSVGLVLCVKYSNMEFERVMRTTACPDILAQYLAVRAH